MHPSTRKRTTSAVCTYVIHIYIYMFRRTPVHQEQHHIRCAHHALRHSCHRCLCTPSTLIHAHRAPCDTRHH